MGDALSTLLAAVRSASSGGVALAPRVPVQGGPVDGALNFTGGVGAAPNAVTGQSDVSIPTGPAGTVLGTNSSGVVTYVPTGGLFYSPVDVGVGYGADGTSGIIEQIYEDRGVYYGQTYGVGFAVTQAGHFCAGARFWWGFDGRAHPLLISLWQHGGTKLATWGASGGSGVVQTVSYGAPIALVPGVPYAITIFDSTPSTSNLSLAPTGGWTYAGSAVSGQTNMGYFVLGGGNQSRQWGSFCIGCDFLGGSSPNDVYGLYSSVSDQIIDHVPNASSSIDYPLIEPVVS